MWGDAGRPFRLLRFDLLLPIGPSVSDSRAWCGKRGDVIDLWSELHHLNLRAAAIDLVSTFGLEPAPRSGTEKRHG